jgi:hypothetical protein
MFECFACGIKKDADPVKTDSTGPVGWDTINISGKIYLLCESCLLRSGLYYPGIKSVRGKIFSFEDLSPIMKEMLKGKIG